MGFFLLIFEDVDIVAVIILVVVVVIIDTLHVIRGQKKGVSVISITRPIFTLSHFLVFFFEVKNERRFFNSSLRCCFGAGIR